VDAAEQQIIFTAKMCVERRAAHIRAIEDFFNDDRVVGFLRNE